jgi:hypothetical protein
MATERSSADPMGAGSPDLRLSQPAGRAGPSRRARGSSAKRGRVSSRPPRRSWDPGSESRLLGQRLSQPRGRRREFPQGLSETGVVVGTNSAPGPVERFAEIAARSFDFASMVEGIRPRVPARPSSSSRPRGTRRGRPGGSGPGERRRGPRQAGDDQSSSERSAGSRLEARRRQRRSRTRPGRSVPSR